MSCKPGSWQRKLTHDKNSALSCASHLKSNTKSAEGIFTVIHLFFMIRLTFGETFWITKYIRCLWIQHQTWSIYFRQDSELLIDRVMLWYISLPSESFPWLPQKQQGKSFVHTGNLHQKLPEVLPLDIPILIKTNIGKLKTNSMQKDIRLWLLKLPLMRLCKLRIFG